MRKALLPLAIAACSLTAQAGTVTTDGADMVIQTKGGFSARTTDGEFSFGLGGRLQMDYNGWDGVTNVYEDDDGNIADGSSADDFFFRRARMELKGHAGDWKYEIAYNLGVDSIDSGIYTASVTYTGFGDLLNLRVGKQKEDFGLDDTGSSKWITAMERAMVVGAFDTGENNGIKLHGATDLFNYNIGVYKEGTDSDNDLERAVTGRFVVRPIYADGVVLHLGAGFTDRESDDDYSMLGSRLGVRGGADGEATRYDANFDNELAAGDSMQAWNLEAAFASGPLHLMAEYYQGEVEAADTVAGSDDLEADGYYLQAGWILTGESRSYSASSGTFGGVKPAAEGGAWEVFARYDAMNLEDGNNILLNGGEDAKVVTLGVNWYATNNIRLGVNYVDARTDDKINSKDDGQAVTARLQLVF